MIEDLLKKQGEPNGYIQGAKAAARWSSACVMARARCTTRSRAKPVYWTGPSVGFDAGANAGKTFVLVYNLYDTARTSTSASRRARGRPMSSAASTPATCAAAMSC
jgi:hypothetical protein